jgi:hypothetical protein
VHADELGALSKRHGLAGENSESFIAVNAYGESLTFDCYTMALGLQD